MAQEGVAASQKSFESEGITVKYKPIKWKSADGNVIIEVPQLPVDRCLPVRLCFQIDKCQNNRNIKQIEFSSKEEL